MLEAGRKSQVQWATGNWIFLDIGFSNRGKTCGLILPDSEPKCVQFAVAQQQIVDHLKNSTSTVNLLIEAPLSICFDVNHNPKHRSIEKQGKKNRFWYVGPGCAVMVAAMYLVHDIHEAKTDVGVRLFEGFLSYKSRSEKSDHHEDVCRLKDAVKNSARFSNSIYEGDQLKAEPSDVLAGALSVAGLNCGIPAVIVVPTLNAH